MPATRKHLLGGAAVCVGVTLSAFSVAWACTPGGGVNVNPRSGVAGSNVLVSANGYETTSEGGAGPVHIRWNSMSGPILASASGPSFSANVTIPESAGARTYYIVAVQELSSGATRTASAPFTVTSSGASPAPAPAEEQPPAPAPAEAQPQPAQQDSAPAPARNDTAAAPDAAVGAPAGAQAPTSATTARRPSARVAPAAGRTAPASAGSRAPAASAAPAPETPALPATPAAEVAALPSGRTVSSDVWSGFREGATSRGPSLVDPTSSTTGSGDAGLALGLIALGTVGLLGATAVGLRVRRRPVAVEASTESS